MGQNEDCLCHPILLTKENYWRKLSSKLSVRGQELLATGMAKNSEESVDLPSTPPPTTFKNTIKIVQIYK